LIIFDDRGVEDLPQPTKDGNRLADELNKAESTMHSMLLTEQTEPDRMTLSLNNLQRITQAENKLGRTILIWIGDGWPMLEDSHYLFTERERGVQFDRVVTSSGELRDARVSPIAHAVQNDGNPAMMRCCRGRLFPRDGMQRHGDQWA
jgi:hypothetical protein